MTNILRGDRVGHAFTHAQEFYAIWGSQVALRGDARELLLGAMRIQAGSGSGAGVVFGYRR